MQKTISSSCYDAIIIRQENKSYRSTPFQVVFSNNLMKQIQKNRLKNVQPYKLSMYVNDNLVDLPLKIDDSGRVVFKKQYLRKGSMAVSDSSDVSDDEMSQRASTRDSRFPKPQTKVDKLQQYKNQQAPKNFWQFAWLFNQKKQAEIERASHKIQKIQQEAEQTSKLTKIKQQIYQGQQNSKEPLFHLSLCGNLLKKKQTKKQILKTFYQHRIQYKDFIKDPPGYLNDTNLVIKIDESLYTWQLGIAILTCRFAYGKQLSKQLIQDIIKNKFTKSKLFNLFSTGPITKLQLQQKQFQAPKPRDVQASSFRNIQRTKLYVSKYRKTPDTQTIKKMKLKYGKNQAKFVLDVGLGTNQQINMKIFLWDHAQKFVISDIDGTITKSDILGQILSKWIHPGVTKLFTQIYKRQYKIIYLTARAIGQYQQTSRFLATVEQDGVSLPEGPLLMSPDGYMRSFTRQIIYKTPDYLKTKVLANINELFPNSKLPIYCGFGNRQTDSSAYLRINIPADKIFCISQKSIISRESDKQLTTTYLDMLENISEYFPQYLRQIAIVKSSDQSQVQQFEAVGLDDVVIPKAKSVDDYQQRLRLQGFDEYELEAIQTVSKSRKSQHEIPQEDIQSLEQFKRFKQNIQNTDREEISQNQAEHAAMIVKEALEQKKQQIEKENQQNKSIKSNTSQKSQKSLKSKQEIIEQLNLEIPQKTQKILEKMQKKIIGGQGHQSCSQIQQNQQSNQNNQAKLESQNKSQEEELTRVKQ